MREIKFRAWDKSKEKMVYQDKLKDGSKDEYWFLLNAQGISLMHFDEHYNAYVDTDAEIMEYTGLRDRTGKEIYEGDIVRRECLDLFYEGGPIIGIVKMIDGNWLIEVDYFNGIILYNDIDSNEVVGNIFENKELLEE